MLTPEKNQMLTQVGPGKPMGELLRRYWMPIAGVSEFDQMAIKPIKLLGESLVLFKDLSAQYGLVDRHCPHRRADLAYGMVESEGLRCNYHGWNFNAAGACIAQPFEDTAFPDRNAKLKVKVKAYPVRAKGGMLWTYMGPLPVPLLPDWEAFSWGNGFAQVVISEVPCNWFQCQENSIDPVHFEWMHENWGTRLRTGSTHLSPTHQKLAFDEFEFGFTYKRIKEDTTDQDDAWTIGRVCLWPNGFFLGEHFEWRVPIDDENTLSVTWKYSRVPKHREPYVQDHIPTWCGPLKDAQGRWIDTHVMNQDFLAWVGQGVIADRTKESLGASDAGVVAMRRRFFEEMDVIAAGGEAKGTLRDPARNHQVSLPMMDRDQLLTGMSVAQIMANPRLKNLYSTYIFQAGQPKDIQAKFAEAMDMPAQDFDGIVLPRSSEKRAT